MPQRRRRRRRSRRNPLTLPKWYIGIQRDGGRVVFQSIRIPTREREGRRFEHVIGPFMSEREAFRTVRAPRLTAFV